MLALLSAACGGSSESGSDFAPEEDVIEPAYTVPTTTPETTEVVTTTTTVPPTTSTTVAPTTTTTKPPTTTTTEDPVARGVAVQIYAISGIASGDPAADSIRDSIIAVGESLLGSYGRVGLLTAEFSNEAGSILVMDVTSGY
ncbi:MAG: hypothetical protein L7T83_01255 [Ilumatobacteraceae bacterium]|nr:hypothetical protein [Ilumatobacteraceae bacterium]